MVYPTANRLHTRLIDWDHVGVGPVSYHLSNFLSHFPFPERRRIFELYLAVMGRLGCSFAPETDWNFLFETAECARLAASVVWRAIAVAEGQPEWAFEDLELVEEWFDNLQAVLPSEPPRAQVQR